MAKARKPERSIKGAKPESAGVGEGALGIVVSFMHASFPGIQVRWKFHHASFLVGGKVFAFTRPYGVVMKLPAVRVRELLEARDAGFLVMGKRVMREWVVIRYSDLAACVQDRELFAEAIWFVGSVS